MSSTSGVGGTTGSTSNTASNVTDKYSQLGVEDFLKLLVEELQNQDPLEPMDNAQILQQLSSIRAIVSSDKLTETMESVILGQNMYTGSSLLGKTISGTDDSKKSVSGVVDQVTVSDGEVKLHVGDQVVSLDNVTEITADTTSSDAS